MWVSLSPPWVECGYLPVLLLQLPLFVIELVLKYIDSADDSSYFLVHFFLSNAQIFELGVGKLVLLEVELVAPARFFGHPLSRLLAVNPGAPLARLSLGAHLFLVQNWKRTCLVRLSMALLVTLLLFRCSICVYLFSFFLYNLARTISVTLKRFSGSNLSQCHHVVVCFPFALFSPLSGWFLAHKILALVCYLAHRFSLVEGP